MTESSKEEAKVEDPAPNKGKEEEVGSQENGAARQEQEKEEEKESCADEPGDKKPTQVKLTRKSPYVTQNGTVSSSSILKGTPKPVVLVKKPPLPKDKPKLPEKPKILLGEKAKAALNSKASALASSNNGQLSSQSFHSSARKSPSPVAAPRKASFRTPNEYANVKTSISDRKLELKPASAASKNQDDDQTDSAKCDPSPGKSDDGKGANLIEETLPADLLARQGVAECYSTEADTQNEVIFEVNATAVKKNSAEQEEEDVQNTKMPTGTNASDNSVSNSAKSDTSASTSSWSSLHKNKEALEEIRKSLSAKLIHKTPPPSSSISTNKESDQETSHENKTEEMQSKNSHVNKSETSEQETNGKSAFDRNDQVSRPSTKRQAPKPPTPETTVKTGVLQSAKRQSSPVKKMVQFSPDTKSSSVPSTVEPISYNRWISKGSTVIESSFTGQPIKMSTDHSSTPSSSGSNKKSMAPMPVYMAQSSPMVDDEVRRWTEKKKRSKSVPRGSEIDEFMGSSKAKPKPRFFPVSTSPPMMRRQSRSEMYESDRRQSHVERMAAKTNRFSFSKIFKQFSGSSGSLNHHGSQSDLINSKRYIMDEEHQREILERERTKLRPAIIHPIDFNSGSPVEVVKIRPNAATSQGHARVFEKHKKASMSNMMSSKNHTSQQVLKARVEYADSKDSGHETSSIHTDGSEGSTTSETSSSSSHSRTNSNLEDTFNKVRIDKDSFSLSCSV